MIPLFQYYRIAAAYLILLIHQQFWAKPLVLGRLTGVAVPLFAAMAGFLFARTLSSDFELKSVLAKKAKRILIPYVIWAVVYWVANGVILDGAIKHEAIVVPSILSWLFGGTACHLWFLPCLFVAFASFTVFAYGCGKVTHFFDLFVIALSAAAQFIGDSTSATFAGYVKLYFSRLMFYFAVGHLLAAIPLNRSIFGRYLCGVTVMIGVGNVMLCWTDGLILNPFLLVVGLVMIADIARDVRVPKLVEKLAVSSMGIYLVHVLFTSGASFALQKIGYSPLPALIGFTLSVVLFAVSYLMVRLLPKKCF